MKITHLRQIGRRLLRELPRSVEAGQEKIPLGRGAGGDRTFPVDRKAEEIILSELMTVQEPLTIVSEEAGIVEVRGGGSLVIVDPVDGSKNAINGLPFYGASIAVADGETVGDIVQAYVINLANGDEFWAEKGSGAFLNNCRVHPQDEEAFFLIAYEAQTPGRDIPAVLPLLSEARRTRCLGAIALDLAYLSCGAISCFVSPALSRSFDFAGGWLLVKESGGIISDTAGAEISGVRLDLTKSTSILASCNASVHARAVGILSAT